MKKINIVLFSSIILLLCSCNNKSQKHINNYNYKTLLVKSSSDNYIDGRIYGGIEPGNEIPSMYIDYHTLESIPLCSNPNCQHNNSDCVARIVGTCPIMLNKNIYYFEYNDDVIELKNSERKYHINSVFCKVSLDSSEVKKIVEFNDCVPNDSCGYLLYNNKIYFIGDNMNPQFDDYGSVTTSNIGGIHYLCSIDLNSGEYKNYGSIYDGDKEYEAANYSSAAEIMGLYNSKIIINYEFKKSFEDSSSPSPWTEVIFEFDPETNVLSASNIPVKPSFVNENTVIYYDMKNKKTVIIKDNEKSEFNIFTGSTASILNNKLFTNDKDSLETIWYDLSDMSVHYVKNHIGFKAVSYYDNCYILTLGNETIKLTEEELLELDKEE